MPTYDYECSKCGHLFDAFQSMSDEPLVKCPSCGRNSLRRLIGGGLGVIFKGSGFYVTDSRSGSGKTGSGSSAGEGTGKEPAASESGSKSGKSSGESSSSGSKSESTKAAT